MPKVSMFIYAENAFPENAPQGTNSQAPKMHLVNPQQVFRPMFIPGLFSFSVVFGVNNFDTSVPHNVKFKFFAPDGSTLIDVGSGIVIPPINEHTQADLPPEMRGFMTNMDLKNVVFSSNGIYKSEVIFDEESLGSFEINVFGMKNNANP